MLSNIERDEKTGLPMGSAVVVANKAGQILAVNRPGEPEKLCLPGGKMEKGESRAENAVRELFEETGVSARESDLKELFFGLCEGGVGGQDYMVACHLVEWSPEMGDPKQLEEGIVPRWIEPEELLASGAFVAYNLKAMDLAGLGEPRHFPL